MLFNTQNKNIDNKTLKDAIRLTAEHRETIEKMNNWKATVEMLENDKQMQTLWKRYQKDNFYAREIEYSDLIYTINKIGQIFDN